MRLTSTLASGWTVDGYARAVFRRRIIVLTAAVITLTLLVAGVSKLQFSTDYRVYFDADNPHLAAYEDLQSAYQKEDSLLLVLAPKSGTIYSPAFLTAVRDLTERSWALPFATRVESVTNFQHSEARDDDIVVESLAPKIGPITETQSRKIRRVSLAEPLLAGRLVPRDEKSAGLYVGLTLPGRNVKEVPRAMAATRALVKNFQESHPDIEVAITGTVALDNAFVESALNDARTLFPAVYGMVFLSILILFPSLTALICMVAIVWLSTAGAAGLAGWMEILFNPVSAAAPLIITTVATADTVHVLASMNSQLRQGAAKLDAIAHALEINFVPISLTSLTTAIGFLSLNFSDAPPFHDLGNVAALGVFLAWSLTLTLLPAMLAVLPVARSRFLDKFHHIQNRICEVSINRPREVLLATALITAILLLWIPRIEINDQFVKYFSTDIQFRTDTDFAAERLTGTYALEFSVDAGGSGAIADPRYLADLDKFSVWLRSQSEVIHVSALPDIMKRLNRNMHGDDPAHDRLPTSRDLAAQYLLLFEMSLPRGQDLRNQINVDRSASRVVATLRNISTRETQALSARAEDWLRDNIATAGKARATGPTVMFSYIYETNIRSMLKGTALALALISLCLIVMLRSVRLGLISLIPNVLPIVMAFGIWGMCVGRVGLAAAVVAAVSLGIVVDNTVHFLSKYRRARLDRGVDAETAVRSAFAVVGPAILTTTVILLCGFVVLSFSSFQANADLGLLTAVAIFIALLTDIFTLPALLVSSGE